MIDIHAACVTCGERPAATSLEMLTAVAVVLVALLVLAVVALVLERYAT